jgi:predicted DNA-binding antitoxin AbrB/MazE fold protein
MTKTIEAIYEGGVFKPLEKVDIQEHTKIKIILQTEPSSMQKVNLEGIIDIAVDCSDNDLSIHHDKYLYGEVSR